jgi:hypothetical protein
MFNLASKKYPQTARAYVKKLWLINQVLGCSPNALPGQPRLHRLLPAPSCKHSEAKRAEQFFREGEIEGAVRVKILHPSSNQPTNLRI